MMKNWIKKLKSDSTEQASLAIFSLMVGLLLSDLLKNYINYFILLLLLTSAFLIIYYKHTQKINTIKNILANYYGKQNGNIVYYADPVDLYKAGSEYVLNAKKEILIYNDYFGQTPVIMGNNTTKEYFNALEGRIKKFASDPSFRMMCIVAASSIKSANLADKYKVHLEKLYSIAHQNNALERIRPFIHADKRTIYTSFTIVDGEILRIVLEGIYMGDEEISSKVVGGFIIEDNEEIISYFRNLFLHTAQQSMAFNSIEDVNRALSS
jgi:hypothetical protein